MEIIFIVASWFLIGFLSYLFLVISYLRKTKYNPNVLKEFDIEFFEIVLLCGWFSPMIILFCYIIDKFGSRKYDFYKWIYDILYKIANVGVKKKSNKEEERADKDEVV